MKIQKAGKDILNPSKQVSLAIYNLYFLVIIVQRGNHDIEHQITFPGSNFIFHDSEGFEAGGESEVDKVEMFIQKRMKRDKLQDQLHAIW